MNFSGKLSAQQQRQSRFDQSPNQFDGGFGGRGGMGGPGGNSAGGPGGMGAGGMGNPGGNQALIAQMGGMGRPDRGNPMMDRRREAPQQRDDMAEMKRMRRY